MFRLTLTFLLVVFVAGCATSRQPSALNQLQIKVAQLERNIEEKDQEIADLKGQVDQLSSQPSTDDMIIPSDSIDDESSEKISTSNVTSIDNERIIRVAASAIDVQKALKNAGFYEGTVDGKIGQKTKLAISKFQKENNLKADGIVGKQTWNELKAHLE